MTAFDNTFRAAIPGSSLTHKRGDLPHEKPPQFTDPNDFLEHLWKQLHQKDTLKMLWHVMENGGTVWAVTRAILYKAVLDGMIQLNLAVTVYKTAFQMVDTLGQAKGIKTKHYPEFKNKTKDMMLKFSAGKLAKENKPLVNQQTQENIDKAKSSKLPDDAVGLLNQLHQNQGNQ